MARGEHTAEDREPRRSAARRRLVVSAVCVAAAGGTVLGIVGWQSHDGKAAASTAPAPTAETVRVKRMDLSNAQTHDGTLGYGHAVTVHGFGSGTVTKLPHVGTTVGRGHELYRVDDRPVPVFYGDTPMYRTLRAEGTVGRDVRVVADNLRALGYDIGRQPPKGAWVTPKRVPSTTSPKPSSSPAGGNGTSDGDSGEPDATSAATPAASPAPTRVRTGDAVLTSSLIAAITRWQTSVGLPATGSLGPDDVVVETGAVRVSGVSAQIGDAASGGLMTVTSTVKQISVSFDADSLGSVGAGDHVTVTLPEGSAVPGRVSSVGSVVRSGSDDPGNDNPPQLTVTVTLENTDKVRHLTSAPVQVAFTSQVRKNVLAVPVNALLALDGGGYALQTPAGRLLPVTTGTFARGMVEIRGDAVAPGTEVVTAS